MIITHSSGLSNMWWQDRRDKSRASSLTLLDDISGAFSGFEYICLCFRSLNHEDQWIYPHQHTSRSNTNSTMHYQTRTIKKQRNLQTRDKAAVIHYITILRNTNKINLTAYSPSVSEMQWTVTDVISIREHNPQHTLTPTLIYCIANAKGFRIH